MLDGPGEAEGGPSEGGFRGMRPRAEGVQKAAGVGHSRGLESSVSSTEDPVCSRQGRLVNAGRCRPVCSTQDAVGSMCTQSCVRTRIFSGPPAVLTCPLVSLRPCTVWSSFFLCVHFPCVDTHARVERKHVVARRVFSLRP